jgi:hypothetical protein
MLPVYKEGNVKGELLLCLKYRVTQKNRELLKNPPKIEEMQQKNFIDKN